MDTIVSILLVGAGGYGNNYIRELLDNADRANYCIEGIVTPKPENCQHISRIRENRIPIFDSMDAFYAKHKADLAIISTPIQYHYEHACLALSHDSNVLCEKPMCATIQDAIKMDELQKKSGRFLAVGYQWSFSSPVLALKNDVITGILGKPIRLKTISLLPRTKHYFSRSWAGKMRDNDGRWVLDSVANNAVSHYLHNMFFILGAEINSSAIPIDVKAELYRINPIESFDTAAMRTFTKDNTEILLYASHAVKDPCGTRFCFEFEKGTVIYPSNDQDKNIVALFHDGSHKCYGDPDQGGMQKLWTCINVIVDKQKHDSPGVLQQTQGIPCGSVAAMSQTLCINGLHESVPKICGFPDELARYDEKSEVNWVAGLSEALKECFDSSILPSEAGKTWAKAGQTINLEGYTHFSSFVD